MSTSALWTGRESFGDQGSLTFAEGMAKAGHNPKWVRRLVKKIVGKGENGRGVQKTRGLSRNGRACNRSKIPKEAFVEALAAEETVLPAGRMTLTEFAQVLGIDYCTACAWCRAGRCHFGPVDVIEGLTPTTQGPKPNGLLPSRACAKAILSAMNRDVTASFTDDDNVKQVPEPQAISRNSTTKRVLRHHNSLGRLPVLKIPYYNRTTKRTAWQWYYPGPRLISLFRHRRNGRVEISSQNTSRPGSNGTLARVRKKAAAANSQTQRKRPAKEKHEKWRQWKEAGLSYNQIMMRHLRETGEPVTRDAVIQALRRME